MLVQIGQDMVMAEQQIRAHQNQTQRTVQLKRLLPEYEYAQEKNLYKSLAIATDARKLIESLDINALQELRSLSQVETAVEETFAAVIMIRKFFSLLSAFISDLRGSVEVKSPSADRSWHKGAKRQMANLERFIEQTQLFDQLNLTEEHIQAIEQTIDRVQLNDRALTLTPHHSVVVTLHRWVKRVLQSVTSLHFTCLTLAAVRNIDITRCCSPRSDLCTTNVDRSKKMWSNKTNV